MLIATLICSGLLLLGATLSMRKGHIGSAATQCVGWLLFPGLVFLSPLHLKFCLALFVLCWLAMGFQVVKQYFLPAGLTIFVTLLGWQAWRDLTELAEYRAEFPLINVADRLPAREQSIGEPQLLPISSARLTRWENLLADQEEERGWYRRRMFRQLHEQAITLFAGNPGFGAMRMPMVISRWRFQEAMRQEEVPDQPGRRPEEPSPAEWNVEGTLKMNASALDGLHQKGQQEFLKPERYGYVNQARQMAGFLSHQFNVKPAEAEVELKRLDLISLLLHDEPVAYDTRKLPRMEELRTTPVRPLEMFEAAALRALRQGEDLIVNETVKTLWMVGALRATKQCLSCHDVQRGELVGAFSYVLERSGK